MRGIFHVSPARLFLLASCFAAWTLVSPAAARAQSGAEAGSSSPDHSSPSASSQSKDETPPKSDKDASHGMTRIRISITSTSGKPIENASVYVRFNQEGGFLHKDKLQELDLKTNQDGSVKVPEIPQGRVLVQVVAKGWKTFGQWYDVDTPEKTIEIKLGPPPHWY